MLNFVLIDDDSTVLHDLSHILESIFMQYDFDGQIGFQTSSVNKLLNYLQLNKADVLLLDINLKSSLNGLEIAEKVRKTNKDCYIIFETAHIEYCLLAYKYKTFDFISKPITYQKLENCIIRLFDDISKETRRFIKLDNKNTIISESEVKFIEKDGMKLVFHTDSRDYEVYSSFAKIQDSLPDNFVRCHKSFIANIDNITKVESYDNTVHFDNKSFCDIGPKYKNNFLKEIYKNGNFG